MFLQFNYFQLEVRSQPVLVKLYPPREAVDVGHLHVVDQGVAVLPGVVTRAAEGHHVDDLDEHLSREYLKTLATHSTSAFDKFYLGEVEIRQGSGEKCYRIIQQSGVSLKVIIFFVTKI